MDPAGIAQVNRRLPPSLQLTTESGVYLYPPLIAILLAPPTVFPVGVAGVLWRVFLLTVSGLGFVGLHRVLVRRIGVTPKAAWCNVLPCIATWPFPHAMRLGQEGALVVASVALAVWAVPEQRFGWADPGLGVAALLKLIPAFSPALFLFRPLRRGR